MQLSRQPDGRRASEHCAGASPEHHQKIMKKETWKQHMVEEDTKDRDFDKLTDEGVGQKYTEGACLRNYLESLEVRQI